MAATMMIIPTRAAAPAAALSASLRRSAAWESGRCCAPVSVAFSGETAKLARFWRTVGGGGVLGCRGARRAKAVEARAAGAGQREKVDYETYQALMRGGEQVTQLLKETAELLEDIAGFNKEEEELALRMAVAGVVGQKLNQLQGNFLIALDWTIERTEKEKDDQKMRVLEVVKETVMSQLASEFPSQVQVVSALCVTPCKDARQEILRRCAGGGGVFKTEKNEDLKLPGANLNDIANQADDILSTMEAQPRIPDRKLLAKLVLVREEARSLLGGGILDVRNDNKGFRNLPEPEVDFLSKIIALKPGPLVKERLSKVMRGKDEGQDKVKENAEKQSPPRKKYINIDQDRNARNSAEDQMEVRPVRPGMFLETVTKLISGMYADKTATGVAVQQLEWVHKVTLDILQEMAYF